MATMRLCSLLLVCVTLLGLGWFFASKPIQLTREFQLTTDVLSWSQIAESTTPKHANLSMRDAMVRGWVRRLDDVSFWNTVTAIIAACLMFRAWARAERHPALGAEPFGWRRAFWIWLPVFASLSMLYLIAVYVNPGSFFWGRNDPRSADATIKTLQWIEGVVNICVIAAASFLLPLGMHLVKVIEIGLGAARPGDDCETLRRSAGALAGVIIAPLCSVLLAFASWKLIRRFAPINPEMLGKEAKWWAVVLFCFAMCLQFVILGLYTHRKLGRHLKVRIDAVKTVCIAIVGALTGVGSLLLFLVVNAEWKGKSPCDR